MINIRFERIIVAHALFCLAAAPGYGQWLQFAGPTRDFKVTAKSPLKAWGEKGPQTIWQRPLGEGYSSILVEGERLYTMYHADGKEAVICLEGATGKTIWEHKYEVPGAKKGDGGYGIGPRSTPCIVSGRIFAVGITGVLHCLNTTDGKVIWSHKLLDEYSGNLPQWGYSCSPLAYKNTIVLSTGGKGKAVAAFDQESGKEVWASGADQNAYSSPVLIKFEGKDQIVILLAGSVAGLNPENGEQIWSFPHKTFADVNAALPVFGSDNVLLITSAYRTGSRAVKLESKNGTVEATQVWANERNGVHHGAVIRDGDIIFGSVGMMGPSFFTALDCAKGGEVIWKEREPFRKATFLKVNDKLLVLDEGGTLGIASVSREGLKAECLTERVLNEPAWTVPTLVDSKVYLRDRKNIMALDISQ